jgi:hypothetical protein
MALITGTALVAIVWQGAVRIVGSKLAKELVKVGAKYLTKKNFKKSYEFFKGNKKIKTSEKNKILEDLNIVTPKVSKVSKVSKSSTPGIKSGESLQAYFARMAKKTKAPKKPEVKKPEAPKTEVKKPEAPKTEVKKPEIPKSDKPVSSEKLHTQVKEHLQSGGSADRGAKIVEEVTKPSLKSQMREILLPNPITKPIRSTFTYGTYGIAGTKVKSMMSDEAADAIERVKLENEKIKKDKEAKEKKIYKKKTDETTLGVIDLNTIVDQEHKWKLDNLGNYVVE